MEAGKGFVEVVFSVFLVVSAERIAGGLEECERGA